MGLIAPTMSGASAPAGTITYAEAATANPDYIFPYLSPQDCSEANSADFQFLMFRPLYWFGLGTSVSLQPQLSLAKLPTFSNGSKTVTINTTAAPATAPGSRAMRRSATARWPA